MLQGYIYSHVINTTFPLCQFMRETHTVPFGAREHLQQTILPARCRGEQVTRLTGRDEKNDLPKAMHIHGLARAWKHSLTLQLHLCQRLNHLFHLFLPSFHFCKLFHKNVIFSMSTTWSVPKVNSVICLKLVIQKIKFKKCQKSQHKGWYQPQSENLATKLPRPLKVKKTRFWVFFHFQDSAYRTVCPVMQARQGYHFLL